MVHFVMYVCCAMLGPWPSFLPTALLIGPAGSSGRTHVGESKSHPNPEHAGDPAERASCRKFVGEFYVWYVAQSKNGDPLHAALRSKKANFSREVIRRLNEDAAAAARSPNEIVGLDFDPVLNSQDFAQKYVPGKVTQSGLRFRVEVFSVQDGKKSGAPDVIPELRHDGSRWVFTNFFYKLDHRTDDLVSILRRLQADRTKRS